jgi:hypothetical protein
VPKKVEISVPTPSNAPRNWISPHPNPYVQPHINNRYIGNIMDKRQEISEMVYNKRVRSLMGRIKGAEGWRGGGVGGWGVGGGE